MYQLVIKTEKFISEIHGLKLYFFVPSIAAGSSTPQANYLPPLFRNC